ncbi:hypothetical protein HDV00_000087 [Rhizophlyctis rosea]|nr:hypothetical protein HDV00_000087 [Rhizophlyctis rosea]
MPDPLQGQAPNVETAVQQQSPSQNSQKYPRPTHRKSTPALRERPSKTGDSDDDTLIAKGKHGKALLEEKLEGGTADMEKENCLTLSQKVGTMLASISLIAYHYVMNEVRLFEKVLTQSILNESDSRGTINDLTNTNIRLQADLQSANRRITDLTTIQKTLQATMDTLLSEQASQIHTLQRQLMIAQAQYDASTIAIVRLQADRDFMHGIIDRLLDVIACLESDLERESAADTAKVTRLEAEICRLNKALEKEHATVVSLGNSHKDAKERLFEMEKERDLAKLIIVARDLLENGCKQLAHNLRNLQSMSTTRVIATVCDERNSRLFNDLNAPLRRRQGRASYDQKLKAGTKGWTDISTLLHAFEWHLLKQHEFPEALDVFLEHLATAANNVILTPQEEAQGLKYRHFQWPGKVERSAEGTFATTLKLNQLVKVLW